jgi:hypothetical protein
VKDDSVLGVDVMGRVENTTDEAMSMVKVAALLFDANGKLIGADFTYLDGELAAGDKKAFECSGLDSDIKASDVAKYTVYAYPTQFNF